MKAFLLIAHGSRRSASNQEVLTLSRHLSADLKPQYPIINAAFLELAEPLIPDAIEQCIHAGATQITVLPYFLSAGRHVEKDIPRAIANAQTKFPQVSISILPHIGASQQMPQMIFDNLKTVSQAPIGLTS